MTMTLSEAAIFRRRDGAGPVGKMPLEPSNWSLDWGGAGTFGEFFINDRVKIYIGFCSHEFVLIGREEG